MKKSLGAGIYVVPTPVWVVGSYDAHGKPNLMTAAWGGVCCSRPPCIYVSLRAATYSHGNILLKKAYTVSIPSDSYLKEVDLIGTISGRNEDKFTRTRLTPVQSSIVDAPYVEEFPVIVECKLKEAIELGLHTQFIGEIIDVKADESVITENNQLDIELIKPLIFTPGKGVYHSIGKKLDDAFLLRKK